MNNLERWTEPLEVADKRTMASQLEARVRQDIINGKLVPGSRLRLRNWPSRTTPG